MLTELRIQNFAIIDDLELSFGPGLIILTGETGAGKSIILDAVTMLIGGRADTTTIRAEAEHAFVEGVFSLKGPEKEALHEILEREELLDDEDYVTLSREVRREGRSIARVNGRTVNVSLLKELGALLVEGFQRFYAQYTFDAVTPVPFVSAAIALVSATTPALAAA